MSDDPVTPLVRAAAAGDQMAWDALVDRFASLVWSVARAHRLTDADAEDVFQTVWLRLVEHLTRLREPEALPGWLSTTTRFECLRVLRLRGRATPVDDEVLEAADDADVGPEHDLLLLERSTGLWEAFAEINGRCQRLLRVLIADPPPSYETVSAALDMPIGSIGPTRRRCLERLRRRLQARGITVPSGASA